MARDCTSRSVATMSLLRQVFADRKEDADEDGPTYNGGRDDEEDDDDDEDELKQADRRDNRLPDGGAGALRDAPPGNNQQERFKSMQASLNTLQAQTNKSAKRMGMLNTPAIRAMNSLSKTVDFGPDGNSMNDAILDMQQKINVLIEATAATSEHTKLLKDTHMGKPSENTWSGHATLEELYSRMPDVGRDDANRGFTDLSLMQARLSEAAKEDARNFTNARNELMRKRDREKQGGKPRPVKPPRAYLSKALWRDLTQLEKEDVSAFEHGVYWPAMQSSAHPQYNLLGYGLVSSQASGYNVESNKGVSVLLNKVLNVRTDVENVLGSITNDRTALINTFMKPAATREQWIALLNRGPLRDPGQDIILHLIRDWMYPQGETLISGLMLAIRKPCNSPHVRDMSLLQALNDVGIKEKALELISINHAFRLSRAGSQYMTTIQQAALLSRLDIIYLFFQSYGLIDEKRGERKRPRLGNLSLGRIRYH